MNGQKPIFILSSGRTGSTFLAKMLNRHPEILIVSDLFEPVGDEPYFHEKQVVDGKGFWDILKRPSYPQRIKSWRRRPNAELLFLHPDDNMVSLLLSYTIPFVSERPMELFAFLEKEVSTYPPDTLPRQLIRFFETLRAWSGKPLWVERTGGSLPHTRKILELWPDAKIVHNYRNPCEIAISMMKGSFFRLYLELEKNPDLGEWDEAHFPPVEEMGDMINRWFVEADAALKEFQGEKMNLAYEDLMSQPADSLLSLISFFLERPPNETDKAWAEAEAAKIRPSSPKFERLDKGAQARLAAAVREATELLGYQPTLHPPTNTTTHQ